MQKNKRKKGILLAGRRVNPAGIEKTRDLFSAIVKQSKDAICIHDQNGRIISWNQGAERMYGYSESEALKMFIWNIIPESLLPKAEMIVKEVIQGKRILEYETKRLTKSGNLISVMYSVSVVTDRTTRLKSIAITERDVTQQKTAEDRILELNADLQKHITRLQRANKNLESFSYSVSHDLKAPLRAIEGHIRIIEEDYGTLHEDVQLLLKRVKANVGKMQHLIEDLLGLSKVGKIEIQMSPTDMEELVHRSWKAVNDTMPNKATVDIKAILPAVADKSLLWQVWINLISNAVKYSRKKDNPNIEIGSFQKEASIVYFVKDNGAGFDMAYSHKLFNAFERLHSSNEFDGTGIGLAIVNTIITRHNGKVWAESKLDEGATFYFSLPSDR